MEVRYSVRAGKALLRSNKRELIRAKIDAFAMNPEAMATNGVSMQGRPECRLRVQDWRVVFRVEGNLMIVGDIAPRGSVYEVKR